MSNRPTKSEIMECALIAGIMLHSGFGQEIPKLMPVIDLKTLQTFVDLLYEKMCERPAEEQKEKA